jgi:hypothetical protein
MLNHSLAHLLAPSTPFSGRVERIRVRGSEVLTLVQSRFDRTRARSDNFVAVMNSTMLRCVYRMPETLIAFHAGVVAHKGAAAIVAGKSGRGKTTLTAALMASGFGFFSDEVAILDRSFRALPAPAPLGLTTESVAILAPFLPHVTDIERQSRRDGTSVHFLRPINIQADPLPVTTLLFPRVVREEPSELHPLGAREAFERLHHAGFDLPNRLSAEDAQGLLQWLCSARSYEVRIGSLPAAVQLISQLS